MEHETPVFLELMQILGCAVFVGLSVFVGLGLLMLAGTGWQQFLDGKKEPRSDGE